MVRMAHDATGLADQRILVVGAGGIGSAIADAVSRAGGVVILAGRSEHADVALDLEDEPSVVAALAEIGPLDHVVSTAGAAAVGPIAEMEMAAVDRALRAKVGGAVLLAKHTAQLLPEHGSLTFLSGFAAWRPSVGQSVMAAANGGLAHLVGALALELAPRRVNAISPGVIDSGAWDRMGPARDAFYARSAERALVGRVGQPADVAEVALLALTNTFITGSVLHVDGGARWA
jgi:NAD(P)-dependent dehydrogenase (short-subunit alcohol dehydrogenase family)